MNTGNIIGEFNEEVDSVANYEERMEAYFIANDITDDKKKTAIVITTIGAKTYKLMRDLLTPKKPMDTKLVDIWVILKNHHNPPPSDIVERYKFNICTRRDGQTVAIYLAELRKLSEFCNFSNKLDEHIRDRLVCGIRNTRIQRLLLARKALSLVTATEIAIGAEVTDEKLCFDWRF